MIVLRKLEEKDAKYMLEWMHDPEIQKSFRKDMSSITQEQACLFCKEAGAQDKLEDGVSLHFAIVDNSDDEYLGTISLKNVDLTNQNAEYAIVTRKKAHGKGVAYQATLLLLEKAFAEYQLHRVYLNVLSYNKAAISLYKKCGFQFEGEFRHHLCINGEYADLHWYGILQSDYEQYEMTIRRETHFV